MGGVCGRSDQERSMRLGLGEGLSHPSSTPSVECSIMSYELCLLKKKKKKKKKKILRYDSSQNCVNKSSSFSIKYIKSSL
jgi:hypothetical protein